MDRKSDNIKSAMQRNRDSILTSLFARSVSVRITPHLADTKITPMQITAMGLVLGLSAAFLGSYSNWFLCILAALLIEASHVLDCVDGELARITDRGNPFAAAMDPISDRVKDIAIILASYINARNMQIFDLSAFSISVLAIITLGVWLLYLYIVDAHLNPARKQKAANESGDQKRLYLGLYDLFIYGSIVFLMFGVFEYFIIYIVIISMAAIPLQIYRLKKITK